MHFTRSSTPACRPKPSLMSFTLIELLGLPAIAPQERRQARERFTLIELLVVVSIIAILAAMLLPALTKAKERARTVVCAGNEKQIAVAWINYVDDYDGGLPAYSTGIWDGVWSSASGAKQWPALMIDQLSPAVYYESQYVFRGDSILMCPSMQYEYNNRHVQYVTYGMYNYGIGGGAGAGATPYRKESQVTQPSALVAFVDSNLESSGIPRLGYCMYARNSNFTTNFRHLNKVNIAFADGHVENWGMTKVFEPIANWTHVAPWGNP